MAKVGGGLTPELLQALRELGIDTEQTARVLIELQSGEVPRIYVTMFADPQVARVVSALRHGEVEIVRTGGQKGDG